MRIAIVTSRTLTVRWFREELVAELAHRGHDVLVLGDDNFEEWRGYFSSLGVRYKAYPVSRTGTSPLEDFRTLLALRRIFLLERPDIVFTYMAKANVYGCLAARLSGVRRRFASVEGLGSVLASNGGLKSSVLRTVLVAEYKAALSGVEACFFVNEDDREYFVSRRLVDEGRAVLTDGVGVNLEKFSFCPYPGGRPRFLYVGRLIAEKGVLEFMEAARLLKKEGVDADFALLGSFDLNPSAISSGDLAPYIEEGAVEYLGETVDVRPELRRCTALVLPSYYAEGLPKSIMEAMAIGRAAIAADNVGCRDVVEHGVTGLLVSPRDPRALADAMAQLASSPEMARLMGMEGRRSAERRFDVHKINEQIIGCMGLAEGPDEYDLSTRGLG